MPSLIEYVSGGTFEQLASRTLTGFNGSGTLGFEVVGSSLKLFLNGILQLAVHNSSIMAAGLVGLLVVRAPGRSVPAEVG